MTTDLNRIAEALRQADAAGDVEGARKLASYYRQAAQAAAAAPAADQPGRLGSFASSVGRGALSVIPGTVGGVGYALGSDTLTGAADTIEGGINRMLPVNPEYQDEFLMKAGGAIGQAGGVLATGGLLGAAGKGLALSRGLAQGAAAAKGADLAKNVLLGTGIAQGIRGGGQEAEKYGLQGGSAYARALLGGAIEGLSERYLFGMGTELAPVKKLLGDAAEKGVGGIVKAAGTEAGEEAAAQIGGNVATSILAPYGVQTPGAFEGAGEAALLGGIAGGTIGGINALIQPSPTIEGETMVPPAGTEPPATAAQEPEDDFGLAAFQQEIEQIVQNPDPIVPLQQTINQAAVTSVKAKADLLPATAAVIEAGGLATTPVQEETPVGAPIVEQPTSGVLLPQPTREEQLAQLINKARLRQSANERADMEQQLAQAQDEGVLADVFAEERRKAAQRDDFLRRQQDLENERQRLADEGILGDVFAEERQRATAREQQRQQPPVVEETVAPIQPVPVVEETGAPQESAARKPRKFSVNPVSDFINEQRIEADLQQRQSDWREKQTERITSKDIITADWEKIRDDIQRGRRGLTVEKALAMVNDAFDKKVIPKQWHDILTARISSTQRPVEETGAPEITPEQVPNVENVLDEPGAAEVGSGMEVPPKVGNTGAIPTAEESARWDAVNAYTTPIVKSKTDEDLDALGFALGVKRQGLGDSAYQDKILANTHPDDLLDALNPPAAQAPTSEPAPTVQRDVTKPEIPAELKAKGIVNIVGSSKDAKTFDKWLADQGVSDSQTNPENGDGGAGYLYLDRGTEKAGQFSWSSKSRTGVDLRLVFKLPDGRNVVWLIETQSIYEVDPTKIDPNPYFKEETAFEKPPEQMSPDEVWADEQATMGAYASKEDTRMVHEMDVNTALGKNKRVSAAAVDAYKITLPEGYVRQGDLYVFQPSGTVESVTEEKAPAKPKNKAGEVRPERAKPKSAPEFTTLHPKTQEKFNTAFEAKDAGAMNSLLDPMNKGSRAEFERRTGVKLPTTQKGTRDSVETWAATTPVADLTDTELDRDLLRLGEYSKKTYASDVLKARALELAKEFQKRQDVAATDKAAGEASSRKKAIAKKALAATGGRGTVGNLAGDSLAQVRADLLSEITDTKVPKSKAGINALMKAFYQEFGIAADTEAGMQKKLAQALQEAVAPTAPAPQAQQPAPQRDTSKPEQMTPGERRDAKIQVIAVETEKGLKPIYYLAIREGDSIGIYGSNYSETDGELIGSAKPVNLIARPTLEEVQQAGSSAPAYIEKLAIDEGAPIHRAKGIGYQSAHQAEIANARLKKAPVSKAAVDAYGITLPEGYVAEGELYVYRPGGEVKAAPAPTSENLEEKKRTRLGKLLGDANRKEGSPSRIEMLDEARALWKTEKEYRYNGLIRLRDDITTLIQSSLGTDTINSKKIAEALIEGRPNLADKIASLAPVKQAEITNAGAYPSTLTGFGYERGVRGVYTHPNAPTKEFGSTNATISTPEGYQAARKRVAKKIGGQTNIGGMLDPVLLKDIIAIGAFYIEGGARSFASFSAKMIEDLGEGVRKYIQPAYDELRKRTDIDTTGMDPVEGVETAPVAEAPTAPAPAPAPAKVEAEAPKAAPTQAAPTQAAPKPAPTAAAEPGVVPIANDPVDAQRVALGLPPIMRMTKEAYTFPQMWSDAEAAMQANPERGKTLVNTLNDKPRNISALEDAILLRERVNRVNALDLAMIEFNEAPKGNNEDQRKALDEAITSLTELDNALAVAGTEQGRSLNARKMLARQDYTLAKMISTLRAANDGNLSEADIATVTRLQKQLEETQKKLAEVESGQADLLADRLAEAEKVAFEAGRQEVLKDIEDRAKADAAKVAEMQKRKAEYLAAKKEAAKTPNKWEEIRAAARARNVELRSNLYSDVVLVKAASMAVNDVIIGATYIAEGVTKFADWVSKMRSEDINLTDDEMQQLFKESKAFDAGEELPASEAPLKTRKTKAPAIDKVKAIAADEEQLDSRTVYNLVVEKMKKRAEESKAAKLPEISPADLTSVISEVTEDVREFFPDITEREIRDLFSGYGKILMPSQDELSKQMRQLSALGKLQSAIEDAEAKRAPLKSGPQRDKATQAIRLQQKKLARELRMMGRDYEAGEDQLRSPLDAIKARLNNQIDDLAFEINNRKKIQRRPTVEYDAETKKLVELRDELKRISDFVNAPAGPTFAELVNEEMKKLDDRIAELQKTLAEGKFALKEDNALYTQELQVKRDERDRLSKLVAQARKKAIGDTRTQEEIDRVAVSETKKAIAELERKIADKDIKRPESRTPTETAEYKALIDEKKKLQGVLSKMRQEAEGRQGMSDEQRIKMATAAIDKSIERMQNMLTSGNYDTPKRASKTPETPELAQKRETRNNLRKQLLELRKLKREAAIDPIAKQLKTDKKRIQTRMKKLKERMDKGDFSKPVKRQKATDQELLDLQVKEEELKEQWAKIVFERQLASRGPGKKILDAGQQIINTARAVLTSFDVSAVLRQGGFIVLGNPVRGFRNLGPMFQAFGSDKFAKEEKFRLQNRENFKNGAYQQSKLFLADVNKVDQMSKQEEAFMSRWIDKLPKGARGLYIGSAIQGSQRAYTVFLNRLRMDTFDAMVANLKKGSEPTPQEMSAAANFINIATGRGDLGKFNQAGTALNTVFFAPRLVASRFQILAGYPYFTASGRTKALVLREYAKFFTGALLVYALGMLAQDDEDEPIETDPRSSDFLKIRFGDTRVDPLSGLIQATVLVSRLVSGEKKQASGKIVPIRGEKVPYGSDDSFDVMGNFARTKFSPIVGSLVNVITGKNVVGETTDVVEETKRMLIPMSFTEMKETFESQGIPEATALTTLQLFGMGVQTYTPGKK